MGRDKKMRKKEVETKENLNESDTIRSVLRMKGNKKGKRREVEKENGKRHQDENKTNKNKGKFDHKHDNFHPVWELKE